MTCAECRRFIDEKGALTAATLAELAAMRRHIATCTPCGLAVMCEMMKTAAQLRLADIPVAMRKVDALDAAIRDDPECQL